VSTFNDAACRSVVPKENCLWAHCACVYTAIRWNYVVLIGPLESILLCQDLVQPQFIQPNYFVPWINMDIWYTYACSIKAPQRLGQHLFIPGIPGRCKQVSKQDNEGVIEWHSARLIYRYFWQPMCTIWCHWTEFIDRVRPSLCPALVVLKLWSPFEGIYFEIIHNVGYIWLIFSKTLVSFWRNLSWDCLQCWLCMTDFWCQYLCMDYALWMFCYLILHMH